MTHHDPTVRAASTSRIGSFAWIHAPALFAATLFVSALLLFAVQPMFAKMVLPRLGGAPAVWSVAMVFFQTALLAGYAYAHWLSRTLPVGLAAIVHLGVLAAVALTLPIGIAANFETPPSSGIGLWLIGLFAASIGLPFVALAASAPLLQNWFGASGHPQATNPYVLYAASNLGSFAALLAYPFIIEPTLTLRSQTLVWTCGFALLALLVAIAGVVVARASANAAAAEPAAAPPATWQDRFGWIALSAIPAGLVVAVTAYISTDVAAAPLLWVLPLALYLLTFVAVFRDRAWIRHEVVIFLVPFLIPALALSLLGGDREYWMTTIVVNLISFFLLALLCHGALYQRRPAPARLTEFFLWTSLGGVLGGIFAGLVAPHIFVRPYEYPVLIVAALLTLPGAFTGSARQFLMRAWPAWLVIALAIVQPLIFDVRLGVSAILPFNIAMVLLAGWMLLQRRDAVRFAALSVVAFVAIATWTPGPHIIETTRSFFGVHQIAENLEGTHRILRHGTTLHGVERIPAAGMPADSRPEPLAYYHFGGPISEGVAAARAVRGRLDHVAIVGLGAGSLACHRHEGETWTFFEIDPEVVRLARDPNLFTFLSRCAPSAPVVLGDARLTLARSPQQYDLIVLDAFSSDAIPAHLLTREALRGYASRLSPHGTMLMHISNRHLNLAPVVAAVGAAEGFTTFLKLGESSEDFAVDYKAAAQVVALARDVADLGGLPAMPGWEKRMPTPSVAAWTDDYSDIIGALMRKKRGY